MERETTRDGGLRVAQRARQGENHEGRAQGERAGHAPSVRPDNLTFTGMCNIELDIIVYI